MNRRFVLSLSMLSGEHALEGPGWYIVAVGEDKKLTRRIDFGRAEDIGRAFEEVLPVGDNTIQVHPFQLVKEGTEAAVEVVNEELAQAEAAATKVARLRRLRADLGGEPNSEGQ